MFTTSAVINYLQATCQSQEAASEMTSWKSAPAFIAWSCHMAGAVQIASTINGA